MMDVADALMRLPNRDLPLRVYDVELFLTALAEARRENRVALMRACGGCTVIVRPQLALAGTLDALAYLHDCLNGRITVAAVAL